MKKAKNKTKSGRLNNVSRNSVIAGILVVLAFAAIALIPAGKSPSLAAGNKQYCAGVQGALTCLNAWNGGPWVRVYNHLNVVNNTFQLGQGGPSNYWYLRYNGPSSWNGRCAGDAYNDPNNHVISLDVCPGSSSNPSGGWGTNWVRLSCGSDGHSWIFKNVHSGGYLGYSLASPGSAYYTNLSLKYANCFHEFSI